MKIAIIGAGISGLAAGWFIKKLYGSAVDFTIFESSSRAGGWIKTTFHEGFLFEQGPRGFRPFGKGEETYSLATSLGLELIGSSSLAKKRYLLLNGKLELFSLKLLMKSGLLKALWRDLTLPPSLKEDETIADFFLHRTSPKLLENIIDPLVKGIYGGDPYLLSCRSCFPSLWEKGSLLKAFLSKPKKKNKHPSLYSFKGGMESLTRKLAEVLEGHICYETPIQSARELESFDHIIAAISPSALSRLYPVKVSFPRASLTTVSCGWNQKVLPHLGFGFLVPAKEKEKILGMTWDSEIFPTQNVGEQTRVCVMLKNGSDPQRAALDAVRRLAKIHEKPSSILVGEAKEAIPQYTLGHYRRLEQLRSSLPPNLHLLGSSYEGVAVNECIANAYDLIKRASFNAKPSFTA